MEARIEDTHSHTEGTKVKDPRKPGPRNNLVRCYIRRDRKKSSFTLWQEPPPKAALEEGKSLDKCEEKFAQKVRSQVNGAPAMEEGKFLLAARKVQGFRSTEYIISSNINPSKDSTIRVVGKLKSNFWNTEFAIYESQPVHMGAVPTVKPTSGRRISSSKVSPGGHTASVKVAAISYKVFPGCQAPMKCSLLTIPASAMECSHLTIPCLCSSKSKLAVGDCHVAEFQSMSSALLSQEGPFVLNSKTPSWNHEHKFWTLRFVPHDRVFLSSVKNYQLFPVKKPVAAATEPHLLSSQTGPLILQFGKCGKDLYSMDYSYPLSAFQGFAIFLSCVDSKFPAHVFYDHPR